MLEDDEVPMTEDEFRALERVVISKLEAELAALRGHGQFYDEGKNLPKEMLARFMSLHGAEAKKMADYLEECKRRVD